MTFTPLETLVASPLALIGTDATFPEYAGFQASGITVVMLTLGGLWLVVAAVSKVVLMVERSVATVPVPKAAFTPPAATPVPAENVDTRTIAVITAAIHAVCGSRARIVSLNPESGPGQAWSKEGRREIYQSHRVR